MAYDAPSYQYLRSLVDIEIDAYIGVLADDITNGIDLGPRHNWSQYIIDLATAAARQMALERKRVRQ